MRADRAAFVEHFGGDKMVLPSAAAEERLNAFRHPYPTLFDQTYEMSGFIGEDSGLWENLGDYSALNPPRSPDPPRSLPRQGAPPDSAPPSSAEPERVESA
jgi:hypothetical protein